MIMYGKYNSDTLIEFVKTVHQMQNVTTWKEKIFVSEMNEWLKNKLAHIHNEFDFLIDTMLILTTIKEKYVRMYEKFIAELRSYLKAIRILLKGYLPITLITPSKLEAILKQVQIAIAKTNQDYELVLNRLYLYYDMKLVTVGIDSQKNIIIQFPVFVQPYTQTKLTLYQIETVQVPILDASNKIQSHTQLKIEKPYIALNDETYISIHSQELNTCKRIGYEYFCEELFVVKSKHKYSCASAMYFNSNHDIKENCDFLATMALQRVRAVEALNTNRQTQNCNSELLKILMILNLVIVVSLLLRRIKKSVFFWGQPFSNMVKIKLFLTDTKSYVSLHLNKIAGNTHLFKLTGEVRLEDICIVLNEKEVHLPTTLVIPLIHKLRFRKLFGKRDLLHVYIMWKQSKSWYNLEGERELNLNGK